MSEVEVTSATPTSRLDDAILDAARRRLLDVGWKRATLTDVARIAGVSRMTIYRRWPDLQVLIGELMTRELLQIGTDVVDHTTGAANAREQVTRTVRTVATSIRHSELFQRIVDVDPEILLTYLVERRGRTQQKLLDGLLPLVRAGQADGSIRAGDPHTLAVSLMLATHGYVISAGTMSDIADEETLAAELSVLVERYLAP